MHRMGGDAELSMSCSVRVVNVGIMDCSIALKLFLHVLQTTVNQKGRRNSPDADGGLRDRTVQTLEAVGQLRQPRVQYL